MFTEYFKNNPPIIKFVNQATLEGNYYLKANINENLVFPCSNFVQWNWKNMGVDIRIESQGKTKERNSIQYNVICELKKEGYIR